MRARIEHGEIDRYAIRLDKVVSQAPEEAAKVVARGALNIKKDAQASVTGLAHARAYPSSITYDAYAGLRGPVAEIGPDKTKRQGALGNLIEYGSVNNPPRPHVRPAVDAELPKFERAMEDLAARLLEDR